MRKFLRYWLPVVAWAGVVSLLSTSALHGDFTYRVLSSVVRFFIPDISQASIELAHTVLRKTAHMAEYFVLSFLLWRALRGDAPDRWRWRWALGTLLLSLGFAGLDEWHQTFEQGRTGSAVDVGFDALGAAIAQLWLWGRTRSFGPGKAEA